MPILTDRLPFLVLANMSTTWRTIREMCTWQVRDWHFNNGKVSNPAVPLFDLLKLFWSPEIALNKVASHIQVLTQTSPLAAAG